MYNFSIVYNGKDYTYIGLIPLNLCIKKTYIPLKFASYDEAIEKAKKEGFIENKDRIWKKEVVS